METQIEEIKNSSTLSLMAPLQRGRGMDRDSGSTTTANNSTLTSVVVRGGGGAEAHELIQRCDRGDPRGDAVVALTKSMPMRGPLWGYHRLDHLVVIKGASCQSTTH